MDTRHCTEPRGRQRPALRTCTALLTAAALLLPATACERGDDAEQGQAGATAEPAELELDPAHGAAQMSRLRVEEIAHTGLPEAMKTNDQATAQKLCNSARERMEYANEHMPDQADGIADAFERVESICSRDLVVLMLDDLLERLRSSSEDDRQTNCMAASVLMAFAFEHRSDDDEVVGRRLAAFELCPNLKTEWDISVSGKPPEPSQPGFGPGEGIVPPPRTLKPTDAVDAPTGDTVPAPDPGADPARPPAPGDAATE